MRNRNSAERCFTIVEGLVIVAIIVLALLGKLSDTVLQSAERRLLGWRDVFDGRAS